MPRCKPECKSVRAQVGCHQKLEDRVSRGPEWQSRWLALPPECKTLQLNQKRTRVAGLGGCQDGMHTHESASGAGFEGVRLRWTMHPDDQPSGLPQVIDSHRSSR